MSVEVKSDEEGFQGSWYEATMLGSLGNAKLLVEYLTLTTHESRQRMRLNFSKKTLGFHASDLVPQKFIRLSILNFLHKWMFGIMMVGGWVIYPKSKMASSTRFFSRIQMRKLILNMSN